MGDEPKLGADLGQPTRQDFSQRMRAGRYEPTGLGEWKDKTDPALFLSQAVVDTLCMLGMVLVDIRDCIGRLPKGR